MTTISLLSGDFEILFDDETVGGNAVAGLKLVRRASGAGSTVYTTNALYTAIADAADDFQAMGFENPMLPVTPNAYTMENDYFIPRSSTEFLKEGAIEAIWGTNVRSILYTVGGGTDFAVGDIGRQVTGGTTTDTGTLLDFEVLPDGTLLAWIRPDDPATDTFDNAAETLTCTGDGGVGNTTSAAISTAGTSLYSSIQAIGSVPTATEVYVVQERFKMTDSTGGFQWWVTDANVSLGIIDILIRVKRDSVDIAAGDVEVFARRYTSLYDNFRLNVSAGGRSALPLASAPDINNTTGYFAALWDAGTGSAMTEGDLLTNTFGGKTGGRYIVTAVVDSGATGTFEYYTTGDLTEFADNDTFTGTRSGTVMGSPTINTGGPTETGAGNGATVTITPGTTTVDHDGDATAEPYTITVDAQGDVTAAKVYERIKYVTRRGALAADIWDTIVPNVDGEVYRGLEVQAQYDAPSGTFNEGDDVDVVASGFTGRVMSTNVTDTYVMLTDQQDSTIPLADDDILRDESTDTVVIMGAPTQFTSPKSSPLGTFTGTVIFGARGVVYINPHSDDNQNYILTDDNGTLRSPPNTVSFVVGNTLSGDRVMVAADTGTSGVINKDQFGGINTPGTPFNDLGDFQIRVAGTTALTDDIPDVGIIRVVETTLQQEHRYVYDSRTLGDNSTNEFTLRDPTPGTPAISTGGTPSGGVATLTDSGALFTTGSIVEVGMLVRNTFVGKTTHVWEVVTVTDADNLEVRQLYGPLDGTQDWDIGDTYTINSLIGDHTVPTNYAISDNVYVPYVDQEATGATTSNSFVKETGANFDVVVNVRRSAVTRNLPFTQNTTVNDAGGASTVVRTEDTIAT